MQQGSPGQPGPTGSTGQTDPNGTTPPNPNAAASSPPIPSAAGSPAQATPTAAANTPATPGGIPAAAPATPPNQDPLALEKEAQRTALQKDIDKNNEKIRQLTNFSNGLNSISNPSVLEIKQLQATNAAVEALKKLNGISELLKNSDTPQGPLGDDDNAALRNNTLFVDKYENLAVKFPAMGATKSTEKQLTQSIKEKTAAIINSDDQTKYNNAVAAKQNAYSLLSAIHGDSGPDKAAKKHLQLSISKQQKIIDEYTEKTKQVEKKPEIIQLKADLAANQALQKKHLDSINNFLGEFTPQQPTPRDFSLGERRRPEANPTSSGSAGPLIVQQSAPTPAEKKFLQERSLAAKARLSEGGELDKIKITEKLDFYSVTKEGTTIGYKGTRNGVESNSESTENIQAMAQDLAHLYVEKVKKGEITPGEDNIITLTASTPEKKAEFERELNIALNKEIAANKTSLHGDKANIVSDLKINGEPRQTIIAAIGAPTPPTSPTPPEAQASPSSARPS